jgi:hypothetical protein
MFLLLLLLSGSVFCSDNLIDNMHNKCHFVITRMNMTDMIEVFDKHGNLIESFLRNHPRRGSFSHLYMHKGYEQLPKKKD